MKNHCFFYVFLGFLHIASTARKPKNTEKSFQEPFAQNFSYKFCLNFVLCLAGLTFGGYWGPPGRLLGTSWALLGACWPLLGASGALLEPSWAPPGWSWASLGRMLALRDAPKLEFRMFLERPGWVWDLFRAGLGPPFANSRRIYVMRIVPFHSIPFRSDPFH